MAEQAYDLVVIGAGGAGSSAANTANEQGKRVALIERDKLGGTCLNYGCDPTKTLLYSAHLLYQAQRAWQYGLRIEAAQADWAALVARVQQIIERMRGGTPDEARQQMQHKGINLIMDEASFVSPHEVKVGNQTLRAEQIIIASGTKESIPPIEGLQESGYITNEQAVSLAQLPKRLAIAGGGPIGIEFSQLFHRFGVEVTVLERSPQLLDTEDRELAEMLCKLLSEEGIKLRTKVELTRVQPDQYGKRLTVKNEDGQEEELVVDEVLIAVGRQPNLDSLNLKAAGVETTKDGIKVDKNLRTNVPHIWAAGDITGGYQFTHVAVDQGKLTAHNAFAREPQAFDDRFIPWGVYTYPTLAHIGKTEEQLRKEGVEYQVGRMNFSEVERAITDGQMEGMVKLLVDKQHKLLGGHILGFNAGSLIAPVVLAMRSGLPVDALADTMLPYPTLAEAVRWAADKL